MNTYARGPKFNSDLACERGRARVTEGITFKKESATIGEWERIEVTDKDGERCIGRPKGHYDTLHLPQLSNMDTIDIEDAIEEVSSELVRICRDKRIIPTRVLVIGLGNRNLTPDSIGPKSTEEINATMHIARLDKAMFDELKCSEIAVIAPGVRNMNGLDTPDLVAGLAERICPTLVIAIDALAARSPKRLGSTIQFSDTGIHPGSGVGFHEKGIDEDLMGAPVIAIGVPTVIDSKLLVEGDDGGVTTNMFVCPKDIDTTTDVAARIISGAINQAFGLTS